MPLFVQLEKKGEPIWHTVTSFENVIEGAAGSSLDFKRQYVCGCGHKELAGATRLIESENPPWTNRHVAAGCFATESDPQG